ncbi:MAG: hypothetical protein ACYCYA_13615 [Actinomycetes bacterium]
MLDFGRQAQDRAGTYLTTDGAFVTNAQVEAVTENYAEGYVSCLSAGGPHLTLGIGTSNYDYNNNVTTAAGQTWGDIVLVTANQLAGTSPAVNDAITVVGADDIELAWSEPTYMYDWLAGYQQYTTSSMLDYGDANSCPQVAGPNGECANYWRQSDVQYVSWGASVSEPLPEIYYNDNGTQWDLITRYSDSYTSDSPMTFQGPLSEGGAVFQSNTQAESTAGSWASLWDALQYYTETQQTPPCESQV